MSLDDGSLEVVSRILGSYGRETSSRIIGDDKRFKAAVLCVFGMVEILDGWLVHVPMPLIG